MEVSTTAGCNRETGPCLLGTKSGLGFFLSLASINGYSGAACGLKRSASGLQTGEPIERSFHLGENIMTNTSKMALRMSLAFALVNTAMSTTAYAEYRCSTPQLLDHWEKGACELARQDTPEALRHYIHKLNMINAGMRLEDYVGKADAERWELVRQKRHLEPGKSAIANGSVKRTEETK